MCSINSKQIWYCHIFTTIGKKRAISQALMVLILLKLFTLFKWHKRESSHSFRKTNHIFRKKRIISQERLAMVTRYVWCITRTSTSKQYALLEWRHETQLQATCLLSYVAQTLQKCQWVHVGSSKNSVLLEDSTRGEAAFLESTSNIALQQTQVCASLSKPSPLFHE